MRFRDLPINSVFEFAHRISGSPTGPWIKTTNRKYYRPCDVKHQADIAKTYNLKDAKFNPHRVGSINVEVTTAVLSEAEAQEVERVKPLMTGKLLR